MTTLLEFKEKLKLIYAKYDIYIVPALKFLLALVVFLLIGSRVGFMSRLTNPLLALLLALMCSFLPVNLMAIMASFLVLGHAYALSLETLVVAFCVLLIMLLLYFRLAPEHGFILMLTPLAFVFKVPYVLPLLLGLTGTPMTVIPVGCGTVIYYLLHYMRKNANMLGESNPEAMQQKIVSLIENLINNKDMQVLLLAFAVTILVVYLIRRLSVDYAWYIAIGVGVIVEFLTVLIGNIMLDASISVGSLILGSLAAGLAAVVLQFFVFSVDYARTEYVQFEDDEYYYYVKAVPKITIAVSEKKVKKINTSKKPAPRKPAPRKPASEGTTASHSRSGAAEKSGSNRRSASEEKPASHSRSASEEKPTSNSRPVRKKNGNDRI